MTRALLLLLLTVTSGRANWPTNWPTYIPKPSFGVTNSVWGGLSNLYTYTTNTWGPFSHFVNRDNPTATDTANAFGSEATPRLTIPRALLPGARVQILGSLTNPHTYNNGETPFNAKQVFEGTGTVSAPIIFYGTNAGGPSNSIAFRPFFKTASIVGDYIILDQLGGTNKANWNLRNDLRAAPTIGISIRSNFLSGDASANGGNSIALGGDTTNTLFVDTMVAIGNHVQYYGNWTNATEDDAGQIILGSGYGTNCWLGWNTSFRNGGDLTRLGNDNAEGTDAGGGYISQRTFVWGNVARQNRENGVDVKEVGHVVIGENEFSEIRPSNSSGGTAIAVHYGNTNIWILGNNLHDCTRPISDTETDVLYVIGNVFVRADRIGFGFYGGGVIHSINNTFISCSNAMELESGTVTSITAANNLFYNTTNFDLVVGSSGVASASTFSNGLFYPALKVHWSGVTYTTLGDWTAAVPAQGRGSISGLSPLFVNAAADDFHLLVGSPARNAANADLTAYNSAFTNQFRDASLSILTFLGTTRPQSSFYDIGAFENTDYVAPVSARISGGAVFSGKAGIQ